MRSRWYPNKDEAALANKKYGALKHTKAADGFMECLKCCGSGLTAKPGDKTWDGCYCEACKGVGRVDIEVHAEQVSKYGLMPI